MHISSSITATTCSTVLRSLKVPRYGSALPMTSWKTGPQSLSALAGVTNRGQSRRPVFTRPRRRTRYPGGLRRRRPRSQVCVPAVTAAPAGLPSGRRAACEPRSEARSLEPHPVGPLLPDRRFWGQKKGRPFQSGGLLFLHLGPRRTQKAWKATQGSCRKSPDRPARGK